MKDRWRSKEKELRVSRYDIRSMYKGRYNNVKYHYCFRTLAHTEEIFSLEKERVSKEKRDHDDDSGNDMLLILSMVILLFFLTVSQQILYPMIIDSCATLHVTPMKELLISYTLGDFEVLKMANDSVSRCSI